MLRRVFGCATTLSLGLVLIVVGHGSSSFGQNANGNLANAPEQCGSTAGRARLAVCQRQYSPLNSQYSPWCAKNGSACMSTAPAIKNVTSTLLSAQLTEMTLDQ